MAGSRIDRSKQNKVVRTGWNSKAIRIALTTYYDSVMVETEYNTDVKPGELRSMAVARIKELTAEIRGVTIKDPVSSIHRCAQPAQHG